MNHVPAIPPQRWAFVVSLVFVIIAPAAMMAYAQSRPAPSLPHIYALTEHGRVLLPGSRLPPGQQVKIIADGFEPQSSVEVVDASRKVVSHVRADRRGVATSRFVAPQDGSAPRPLVVMAAPGRTRPARSIRRTVPAGRPAPRAAASTSGDPQTLTVRAPLVRQFRYLPGPSHQVDAGSASGARPGSGAGGLAGTGFDVAALIIAGLLAILLGLSSIVASRRRGNPRQMA